MTLRSAVHTQVGRGKHDEKEKAVRVISLLKMKTLHTVMRVGRLFAAVATQAFFFFFHKHMRDPGKENTKLQKGKKEGVGNP